MQVSGIILAGGSSRRMGRDKAWIELRGRPLVAHVADRLRRVAGEVLVVSNGRAGYESLGLPVIPDAFPGGGALVGIYSGLAGAANDRAIVVACDMPFLNPDLLSYMTGQAEEYDVVVARVPDTNGEPPKKKTGASALESGLHPLHAVYSRRCLEPIRRRLEAGDRRIISFYPDVRVRILDVTEVDRFDPEHLSFFNANTPEQLEVARRLAEHP